MHALLCELQQQPNVSRYEAIVEGFVEADALCLGSGGGVGEDFVAACLLLGRPAVGQEFGLKLRHGRNR